MYGMHTLRFNRRMRHEKRSDMNSPLARRMPLICFVAKRTLSSGMLFVRETKSYCTPRRILEVLGVPSANHFFMDRIHPKWSAARTMVSNNHDATWGPNVSELWSSR